MKLEVITIEDKQVTFDVTMLMKEDAVMINATEVAKHFGKLPADWLRLKETQDYINAVSRYGNSHIEDLSKPKSRLQKDLSSDGVSQYGNSHTEDLVRVQNGGKYKGTWIHSKLAIMFARWLDADFAVMCDMAISRMIRGEQQRKAERLKAKTGYAPLTLAIQSSHIEPKFYHFSNEANLINRIILGIDAKDFKNQNGIDLSDATRDHMTVEQLYYLDELQKYDTALLTMEYDYNDRKDLLMTYYVKLIQKKGRLEQLKRKQIKAA